MYPHPNKIFQKPNEDTFDYISSFWDYFAWQKVHDYCIILSSETSSPSILKATKMSWLIFVSSKDLAHSNTDSISL